MSDIDDGGPAFPTVVPPVPTMGLAPGMSLRDWFAGQALAGLAAYTGSFGSMGALDEIARRSYEVADAMLAARKKESKP